MATALFAGAVVLVVRLRTAMPKLAEYEGVQPGGGDPDGEIAAVTA